MADICGRNPRLTDSSERLYDSSLRSALDVVSDVVLDRSRIWESKVIPSDIQEVPKVFKTIVGHDQIGVPPPPPPPPPGPVLKPVARPGFLFRIPIR